MRTSIVFLLFVLLHGPLTAQMHTGSFTFDGGTRDYFVILPRNYSDSVDFPLVLYLHCYDWTAEQGMDYTKLHQVADTAGYIVAYPSAIPNWNSGIGDSPWYRTPHHDDVGFLNTLIDTLLQNFRIDHTRMYACGYSNGGFMSYRLASELSHRIAAIASVGGVMAHSVAATLNPYRPVSILHMHGTGDAFIPLRGNEYLPSVDSTLRHWIAFNDCMDTVTTVLPDIDRDDRCTVHKIDYTNCSENSIVTYYKVVTGGHTWPGAGPTGFNAGNTNQDIDASTEILRFFGKVTNPLADMAFGRTLVVSPTHLAAQGDSIHLQARITNPEYHTLTCIAKYEAANDAFQDSVSLYDDGTHGDDQAGDNIWGATMWISGLAEDLFTLHLRTHDQELGTTHTLADAARFATAGPVVVDSFFTSTGSLTLHPGDSIMIALVLRNNGSTASIEEVSSALVSRSPCVERVIAEGAVYGDIAPQTSETMFGAYTIVMHDNCPGASTVIFDVSIASNGYALWSDSIAFDFTTDIPASLEMSPARYSLEQNYPNPFNPSTRITYHLPRSATTTIEVFDLYGQKVSRLLDRRMPAGTHAIDFVPEGLPSGVYFYRIEAGNFHDVKAMVLIR